MGFVFTKDHKRKLVAKENTIHQTCHSSKTFPKKIEGNLNTLSSFRQEYKTNPMKAYLNINLGNKITDVRELCRQSNVDIVCICETKLDSNCPDAQFLINNYQFLLFRRDHNKDGGGKMVFVKKAFNYVNEKFRDK